MGADRAAGIAHLRAVDPVMRDLIDSVGPDGIRERPPDLPTDVYGALIRAIVGQQLSTASAGAIFGRILARYGGRSPTPQEILAEDPDELRVAVGLSHAKTVYLRSLAQHVLDGSLQLDRLAALPDDAVITELTAVKGVGEWSADMFLMFTLGRPDVLAVGDLGIRQAFRDLYGFDSLPGRAEMEAIAEPWRPYRTLGCLFLWRSRRVQPV
jgi:DNA-3-methyladenine glycosylase II